MNMLTQGDMQQLAGIFATKKELRDVEQGLEQRLSAKIEEHTGAIVKEIHTVIEMLGENISNTRRQKETLDDHEVRLHRLERISPFK